MTVLEYMETVLDGVGKYRPDQTVFIVSLDRRMKSWSPSGKEGGESSVLIYAVTPP